jgi:dTDP-glucose 4,6-dehydratase
MKVLITGGAGFIGANFIHYWVKTHPEDKIVNLDKLTYAADLHNLRDLKTNKNYSFIKGDISNKSTVDKLASKVDAIINFAAESHVDRSIADSSNFLRSNIIGVHNLLEISRKHKIRFHQVSTDEVYGSLKLGSSVKFTEASRYAPKNPYAATKASADHLVNAYYNTYDLPVTISNCSNNYGPYQHPEKLIPKTIINAILGNEIPVYGNGLQIRDWIYVEDHCSALDIILKKGLYGETYLVGVNNERQNIDVVKMILTQLEVNKDAIKFVADRPGHDVRYAIDSTKIKKKLGWKPKFGFENGLTMTIAHYIKNFKSYSNKLG